MVRQRHDRQTADLFEWEPPQVAVGYSPDVAGRGQLESQISRLVGRALRDHRDEQGGSRADLMNSGPDERPIGSDQALFCRVARAIERRHRQGPMVRTRCGRVAPQTQLSWHGRDAVHN